MDVNPFKKSGNGTEESMDMDMPSSSSFKKMRDFCASCYPRSGAGWLAFLLALAILWKIGSSFGVLPSLSFPSVDGNKYQAVFLTNGQVYFGHIKEANRDYAMLSDIYYLRVSEQLQPPSQQPQTSINLVKLGSEIHGPEDSMYVPKGQIIFWENMRDDSPVTQVINQLKTQEAQAK